MSINVRRGSSPHEEDVSSTPRLLNSCYSRLRSCSRAYKHCCAVDELSALHTWMMSFGNRLDHMAELLADAGAKEMKSLLSSADSLMLQENCDKPSNLLREAIEVQISLCEAFERLTYRLDMEAELYELITEYHMELCEVEDDMRTLLHEYQTDYDLSDIA